MQEIDNHFFGKLKFYSVEEGRTNFCRILKDREFKAVITRHKKPVKIVLDYQEYSNLLIAAQIVNKDSVFLDIA